MTLKVLGIAGSLRAGSYNRALLRAAKELAPDGMTIELAEIGDIPLYNKDVQDQGMPAPVVEIRRRIAEADALLIATPEYNHSVSGVLKNAIDWISRGSDQPLSGKPCAIMGASDGLIGTARAQVHLRDIAVTVNMPVLPKPEVLVGRAQDKVNEKLELVDEPTRQHIAKLLVALRDWALLLKGRK